MSTTLVELKDSLGPDAETTAPNSTAPEKPLTLAIVMAAAPAESSRRLRPLGSDKRLNLVRDKKTLPETVTAPLVAITSTVNA